MKSWFVVGSRDRATQPKQRPTGDRVTHPTHQVSDTSADLSVETGGTHLTVAPSPYTLGDVPGPLDRDQLRLIDAWWRAANYLAVGQIYLLDNPLLVAPLQAEHHGLSHSWSTERLQALAPLARRVVIAHLGGGSSLCGVADGESRVTTMGFTPLDGLVMASRVGHIDPGAVRWLSRHADVDVDDLLSRRSGLVGLTGTSDLREVIARAHAGDTDARLALEMWQHRFITELGGCVAVIGGLDALAFTGGIGEHADGLRSQLCDQLRWLGVRTGAPVEIDGSPYGEQELSAAESSVRVFVIPAREDLILARTAAALLRSGHQP
jgi:hypothetical protein